MKSPCHCINIRFAARKVTKFYDDALKEVGLTCPQHFLLLKLSKEGEANMKAFARLAGLDRTTLVRNIRPLLEAGMIEVDQVDGDARQKMVKLTKRGKKVVEKAKPLWESAQASLEKTLGLNAVKLLDELAELIPALD